MKTFMEMENACAAVFRNGEPYCHAYTDGRNTPVLFVEENQFVFVMNVIAQTAANFRDVGVIAFEVMNNHFHFVLSAQPERAVGFWNYLRKRLSRTFPLLRGVNLQVKQIAGLQSLRNNIAYVNRNGYVASSRYTPFSYPWGTGRYYFLDWPAGKPMREVPFEKKRAMFKCRTVDVPAEWRITGGFIPPCEYCRIDAGMSMFRDAHHYYSAVSKSFESYAEVAAELDDTELLTDAEMFVQVVRLLRREYGVSGVAELGRSQKMDLVVRMRRDWRASNGQIRRVLGLSQFEVDALFPSVDR